MVLVRFLKIIKGLIYVCLVKTRYTFREMVVSTNCIVHRSFYISNGGKATAKPVAEVL